MTAQYLIRKIDTCEHCEGNGWIRRPHCTLCGATVSERAMSALDRADRLPCGHSIHKLNEDDWCGECEGEGKIETWLSLADALRELGVLIGLTVAEAQ